jgi:starch synthase (maltosyl-transferring)
MLQPRVVIDKVSPCVDNGGYPAKATLNQAFTVSATIFTDGHDQLAARVLYQQSPRGKWRSKILHPMGNDHWETVVVPQKTGRYQFKIEAWFDQWATYCDEVTKKHRAGLPLHVELEEGRLLLLAALHSRRYKKAETVDIQQVGQAQPNTRTAGRQKINQQETKHLSEVIQSESEYPITEAVDIVTHSIDEFHVAEKIGDTERMIGIILNQRVFKAMEALEERRFYTATDQTFVVEVERGIAGFASWYELFPRSVTSDPEIHGTFANVISLLPAIKAMGFDVVYFPPIHPIGKQYRKGRNNARTASPGEPGSPYAIGGAEGGHDAVLPELGGIEEFRRLRNAAGNHGLEIALDFAIHCSPDHPWLTEHPDWFSWRPDGSLKYAENPPKKYQDIVNVNFYAASAVPALWEAWRDIVLYWISEGVKIFRVDNPHTKPLPFWEWLIRDVRGKHPEVIFLSEAFTRPAMMYQLAKIGFNQSYTYFIWRNTKQELTDYLTELTTTTVKDYFRPNFFVNTPDINPYFLQTAGRPGFLIRAALASTLSGLWGMYSGFEVCEAAALPEKEEYLNAEKYEIKPRDYTIPGNIVQEISQLNHIRKANPALHTHLNIKFLESHNDQVLFFAKYTHDGDNVILVAISLDPHHPQEAWLHLPLDWIRNLMGNDGSFSAHELMRGLDIPWSRATQHWYFNPEEMPFAIFRLSA